MMVHHYSAITDSILTSSITIWYAAARDKGRLKRIIRSAESDWLQSSFSSGTASLQDSEASRKLQLTPPTLNTNSFRLTPLAGGCGLSGPKPLATKTASSCLQLATLTRPWSPTDTFHVLVMYATHI
ncbi:hypothetical protein CHARACLAT_030969 [Characodon lateralis]|uniref:Uncharacterized protein n=1 Tax=Characodon lateralis TaxID=208331 RepID=A0ABU7CUS9_9TELE|nr:hypothetical protein [Characodon lateralis]